MRKNSVSFLSAVVLLLAANTSLFAQSSEENAGRAAEQAGKLREALTQYVAALQSVSEGSADDQRLRETIIKLVQKLSPSPAIPEEATRFSVRGETSIKDAKSTADFAEAAKEFSKAVRVAPWWADGYYNLAVAQEKAGQLNEAIRSLKLYLLAAPASPDAEKIKRQIYALEYRQEKAAKEAVAKREEQERRRREEEARVNNPARLAGEWCLVTRVGTACGWTVKVIGNIAEFWTLHTDYSRQSYRAVFRGKVDGERIAGSYIVYYEIACGWQEFPMEATISPDGNRIDISYDIFSRQGPVRCIPQTITEKQTLVRK